MQISELTSLLGITKENLRYYEKEGLISPSRRENGYRDYSEDDIEKLKKVLVLRKLGVPVADIREIFEGGKDLSEALNETAARLDAEIASMEQARQLCEDLRKEHLSINELNADLILERIRDKEPAGFNDLKRDVLSYTSELFVESFGHLQWFFPIFKPLLWKRKRKGSAVLAAVMLVLMILAAGAVCSRMSMRNNAPEGFYFLRGMLTMCMIILIWLVLRNIVYFLSKRYAKAEKAIAVSGAVLAALVSIGLYTCAILHWGHILMFTPYKEEPVFRSETALAVQINADTDLGSEENDWTASRRYHYYDVSDPDYIRELKEAVKACEPNGKWSVLVNDQTLFQSRRLSGFPDMFYQIIWTGENDEPATFFYLVKDENGEWLLDEPNYGVFQAGPELMNLIQSYDDHISIRDGVLYTWRNVFEYDPEKIWKDTLYKDGRFDTYRYLTLLDADTGEDVTDCFINEYKDAFENEEWETVITAFESVNVIWRSEYVHPEKAHME